jgi:hypothetical protein
MSKWSFFGRIIPERVPVTLAIPLEARARSSFGFRYNFRVAIHQSQAVVDIEVTEGDPDLATLRNTAGASVRTITDLIGYQRGCYFDVEILSAVSKNTDEWAVFGIEIPILVKWRNNDSIGVFENRLLQNIGAYIPAQIVLADFREAMRVAVGTGFYCYRAVEAMMQSMKTSPQDKDRYAWESLRNALCIDRSAIEYVKQHADLARHGKPASITDADRGKVLQLTDEIIRRFLAFIMRDKSGLPPNEFPTLSNRTERN